MFSVCWYPPLSPPLHHWLDSALTETIFHSLGKLLCKIIFVYYKLHRPTVILGVLSLAVVLLQSLCSFCTNNDMKREHWKLPTVIRNKQRSGTSPRHRAEGRVGKCSSVLSDVCRTIRTMFPVTLSHSYANVNHPKCSNSTVNYKLAG